MRLKRFRDVSGSRLLIKTTIGRWWGAERRPETRRNRQSAVGCAEESRKWHATDAEDAAAEWHMV